MQPRALSHIDMSQDCKSAYAGSIPTQASKQKNMKPAQAGFMRLRLRDRVTSQLQRPPPLR